MELKLYLYADLISSTPFFEGIVPLMLKALVLSLKHGIYACGDFVIQKNESAKEMFFIIKGIAEVLVELDKPPVVKFSKCQYFGEMALYRSVDRSAKRTAWVRAVAFCNLAKLSRDSFEDILNEFPDEANVML